MTLERENLAISIVEAVWGDLRAHLGRGGLIHVDDNLDLADTALRVANDDVDIIRQWVDSGLVGKPSDTKIRCWDEDKQKKFSMLIVSPFVLIQEKVSTFH